MAQAISNIEITGIDVAQEGPEIRYTRGSVAFKDTTKSFQRTLFDMLENIGRELSTDGEDVYLPYHRITISAEDKDSPGALFLISQETSTLQQLSETNLTLYNNTREIEKSLEKMI